MQMEKSKPLQMQTVLLRDMMTMFAVFLQSKSMAEACFQELLEQK